MEPCDKMKIHTVAKPPRMLISGPLWFHIVVLSTTPALLVLYVVV